MIICIPLIEQSDYTELMYALRSIEKFSFYENEIVIVGHGLPDWITNITQIDVKDIPGRKQFSIRKKIIAALEYSDKIFFTNDDIYFLKPFSAEESFPYYCHRNITKTMEAGAAQLYDKLQELKKPLRHFDIHCPIVYEKEKFRGLEMFPSECIIKSMYGNYYEIPGIEMPDYKVNRATSAIEIRKRIDGRRFFSSGSVSLKYVYQVLNEIFPNPSKYEI